MFGVRRWGGYGCQESVVVWAKSCCRCRRDPKQNSKIDEHNTDYLPRFVFLYGICRAFIMVECQLQLRNRTSVNQI